MIPQWCCQALSFFHSLLCHPFYVCLYPLDSCLVVTIWLLYLQVKYLHSSQEVEEGERSKGLCQPNIYAPTPTLKKSRHIKALPETHLINAYISLFISQNCITWSVRQAGTFGDDGRGRVVNQQTNGHTVLLNHMQYSKFQGQPVEQIWKGVGEGNFEVNWY